jgi:hypothetical protein
MAEEVTCAICSKPIAEHSYRYANEKGQAVHGTCYEEFLLETTSNPDAPSRPEPGS